MLSEQIATILNKDIGNVNIINYADGEIGIQILSSVQYKDIYIIQSVSPTPNIHDHLMELLLFISAAKRASARKVTAIIPYLAYSRQDRIRHKRETIAAGDVALMLEAVGVDQIVFVDIHRSQCEGFYDLSKITVENLETLRLALPILLEKDLYNPVIVCPSDTGVFRAKKLLHLLQDEGVISNLAFVTTRQRDNTLEFQELTSHHRVTESQGAQIVGDDVKYRDVIIIDDMIDTGSRLLNAAKICKEQGCARIYAFATHGLFSGDALDLIRKSDIDEVIITNTIFPPPTIMDGSQEWCEKLSYVSVAPVIAECIRRIQVNNSLASMTHLIE
jgi:ribose-phosphate pyrophosphokinase